VSLSAALAAALGLWVRARRRCDARLARAADAAAEERRRFLRRLDHELKNPLTAARVALANLAVASDAGAYSEAAVATLEAQTARIEGLVGDLRKLAELETRPLTFEAVDLGEVLREVVAADGDAAMSADGESPALRPVTLTLPQAPWPLPEVDGDWDLLFLAVYNLVSNARKFTAPGDAIELRAFEDGREVVVEVADTGPGVSEAEQALVWEELYRAEAARGIPGSGLGLALVRTIVARHGGNATLRSREGQGTVVTVRLPARQG
jgi:two-component system OmpR family sensor kinase